MDEKTIASYVGSMQQLASVRPFMYTEGRAANMRAFEVKNGHINFTVMADKCLDIADCSYKGINLNFISKPGLMGRNHFDTNNIEAKRSIMGGLLFTCGLENICPPCTDEGVDYPMHGRLRSTPAEHLCADAGWVDGEYRVVISGEMREAELFGENMQLRRNISTVLGQNTITIHDEFKNCGYEAQPFMLLYHFNIGYPFLKEGCRIVLPVEKTTVRDSAGNLSRWNIMDAPSQGSQEQVFIHELRADKTGNTFATIVNDEFNMGLKLSFNKNMLPKFMEWKSTAAGDYVLGLEPANSSVYGRLEQKKEGLPMLAPFESRDIEIIFAILDGVEEIKSVNKHPLI